MSEQEDEQKDVDTETKNEQSSTKTGQQESAGSGSGSGTQAGYVTEESYKGLQRAAEKQKQKLENELVAMRQKLEAASTELEEAKLAALEKQKLEAAQGELNTSIQALQAERDRLTRQLNQQKIVLAKYPELASLSAYIPPADDDEAFENNARSFKEALKLYVTQTLKGSFEGATPPIGSGNQSAESGALDELWARVYRLAGIPGKETEYEEAYAKLQESIRSQ